VNNILQRWKTFLKEENGATAIEYALIASILGIALLPVLTSTTSGVASLYVRVQDYFAIVNGG
jgi:Flp pilus assembly pilin Flp